MGAPKFHEISHDPTWWQSISQDFAQFNCIGTQILGATILDHKSFCLIQDGSTQVSWWERPTGTSFFTHLRKPWWHMLWEPLIQGNGESHTCSLSVGMRECSATIGVHHSRTKHRNLIASSSRPGGRKNRNRMQGKGSHTKEHTFYSTIKGRIESQVSEKYTWVLEAGNLWRVGFQLEMLYFR